MYSNPQGKEDCLMQTLFFVCFGVGAGFTIISFLLGEALGHLHFGGGVDGGIDMHVDTTGLDAHIDGLDMHGLDMHGADMHGIDAHIGGGLDTHVGGGPDVSVSPLKPSVIAVFLTVFGGAGLLLNDRLDWLLTLGGAGALGLIIAYAIYRFIIVPLYKHQNTSAVEKQSLIGHNAKVTVAIPQGGYGKITYIAHGNTHSAPAKSENGQPIPTLSNVEIVYIEKSTCFVRSK